MTYQIGDRVVRTSDNKRATVLDVGMRVPIMSKPGEHSDDGVAISTDGGAAYMIVEQRFIRPAE